MDFNSEVRKSLKTKEELRKEAEETAAQEAKRIENKVAEGNYRRLKEEILLRARSGEAVDGKIFGVFELGGVHVYDEVHGFFRDLFEIQEKYCILRRSAATGAVISGHLAAQRPPVIRWSF